MKEAIKQNLKTVRAEAHEMLKTLKAVRGEKYHQAVYYLLVSTQVAEIVSHLVALAEDNDQVASHIMAFAIGDNLSTAATIMLESTGLSEGEIKEALDDAKRISENTHSLIDSAFAAGKEGKAFGGADA
jgi:hypothetical protein